MRLAWLRMAVHCAKLLTAVLISSSSYLVARTTTELREPAAARPETAVEGLRAKAICDELAEQ